MTISYTYSALIDKISNWIFSNADNIGSKYDSIDNTYKSTYNEIYYPEWVKGQYSFYYEETYIRWWGKETKSVKRSGTNHNGSKPFVQIIYKSNEITKKTIASSQTIAAHFKSFLSSKSFSYESAITVNGLMSFTQLMLAYCTYTLKYFNNCRSAEKGFNKVYLQYDNVDISSINVNTYAIAFDNDDLIRAASTKNLYDYLISNIRNSIRYVATQYNFLAGRGKADTSNVAYSLTLTCQYDIALIGAGSYYKGDDVTIEALTPVRPDGSLIQYAFNGWYNYNTKKKISTTAAYSFTMPDENLTLSALYKEASQKKLIIKTNSKQGKASIVYVDFEKDDNGYIVSQKIIYLLSAEIYQSDQFQISASANPGYTFSGWYSGKKLYSNLATYIGSMPNDNLTLSAAWSKA